MSASVIEALEPAFYWAKISQLEGLNLSRNLKKYIRLNLINFSLKY